MNLCCMCLLLLTLLGASSGEVPPTSEKYKILMLLPISSKSHRNVFMPLAEALADRGHQIVMLTNNAKLSKHPNIHEIYHGITDFDSDKMNMFEERKKPESGIGVLRKTLPIMARKLYQVPEVKELYEKRKEFDLIVINHMFNEAIYPIAYEMPFITIATPGMDYRQSAVLGNPLCPALVTGFIGNFDLNTVIGRLLNTMSLILVGIYWRNWGIVPPIQKEIDVYFPDLPPLLDLERNQSLTLLNSHFSMDQVHPLLPSQVEVGGMHCRPAKPLPEDLKTWIEGAGPAGVIYFSLGSVARGETMPNEFRMLFIEAFKKLDQRILWKFEKDIEGVSKNVMISNWLPQQDILAHPNVKVFITHGGLLSTQEASYHGTPMLVLPIYGDQPKNGLKIQAQGLGITLTWEELTVDLIVNSLREFINNPRYKEKAQEVSRLSKDQLESPLDRAIFWTEYVIRNNGAPRLRSPAADLSWIEFLLLDVIFVTVLIILIVLVTIRWIFRKIFKSIFGKNKKKRKHE